MVKLTFHIKLRVTVWISIWLYLAEGEKTHTTFQVKNILVFTYRSQQLLVTTAVQMHSSKNFKLSTQAILQQPVF